MVNGSGAGAVSLTTICGAIMRGHVPLSWFVVVLKPFQRLDNLSAPVSVVQVLVIPFCIWSLQ
jgi:hypothetical protein